MREVISTAPRTPLARLAWFALLAGGVTAAGLTLYASRHNPSLLLRLMFVVWVLFPFASALTANRFSGGWRSGTATTLHVSSVLICFAALGVYGAAAFGQAGVKLGFLFLVVPPASGLMIAIVVLIASFV